MEGGDGGSSGPMALASPTVPTLIGQHAAVRPERPAIIMPKGNLLTYGALGVQIAAFGAALRATGIGRSGRVAIMLPNGPELAVAILAAACHAAAVPLSPKLSATELDGLFATLRIDAVVVSDPVDPAARDVAARHGARLLKAFRRGPGSLEFSVGAPVAFTRVDGEMAPDEGAQPDDPALILRTSATTGRPKIVPVTHRNLIATAERRRHWFDLSPDDRALCTVPLYYAQALKSALFTPLLVGGSLACPDRPTDGDFLNWLVDLQPTWYVAGPTFHNAVLERVLTRRGTPPRHCLRFIRSGAAPLPAAVHQGLEEVFGVPVLESYGLSEAGTIAANAIAPEHRKPGTVGRPWPNQAAIRGDDGSLLPPGRVGEIVVRGAGVMPGYLDNEEANSVAFVDGWFRTGDLGSVDGEGFLTLSGRLKELINRGGEKISPYEVEKALMLHSAVREAAAFSVPHPRLGENVGAAVVIKSGMNATASEIKEFLCDQLAQFKVPQHVFVMSELPKGATGKISRSELSEAAANRIRAIVPPKEPLEFQILEIWQRLIGRTDIGIDDDFFEAGGDSLLATHMVLEVEAVIRQHVPPSALRAVYTIRQLTAAVLRASPVVDELVTRAKDGNGTPFFFCHGDYGTRGLYALKLADKLKCDQPVFLLHSSRDPDPKLTIEEMARSYVPHVLAALPTGALRIGGHCNGGLIAWEVARQLERLGREVEFVVLVETISLNARLALRVIAGLMRFIAVFAPRRIGKKFKRDGMRAVWNRSKWRAASYGPYSRAMANYIPSKLKTGVLSVICEESRSKIEFSSRPWNRLCPELHCRYVAGTHIGCITSQVDELALLLDGLLSAGLR
jgi:acyl-CoA synthetase (AMP-forming)/AMP-acid ligase II